MLGKDVDYVQIDKPHKQEISKGSIEEWFLIMTWTYFKY